MGLVSTEQHVCEFKEEYYGYHCKCGVFYAYGCEPWAPEPIDGEYDEKWEAFMDGDEDEYCDGLDFDCGMTPDGLCGKAGSEECDWECPFNQP